MMSMMMVVNGGGVHDVEEKNDKEEEADEDDGGGVVENGNGDGKRDVNKINFINNRMPPKKKKRYSLGAEQKKLGDEQNTHGFPMCVNKRNGSIKASSDVMKLTN